MGKKNSCFISVKRFFLSERKLKSEEKPKKEVWLFNMFRDRKHGANEAPLGQDEFVIQNLSALRIQCAFRRHLAKKALSAMKGVVKLQAIIRGRLLRKYLTERLASIHSHSTLIDYLDDIETIRHRDERIKSKNNIRLDWDQSFVQEEGSDIRNTTKQERMKQYSYSHREMKNEENRKSKRFDQHLEVRISGHARRRLKESDSPRLSSSYRYANHKSIGEDNESSLPNSPVFPAYMAPTESAMARVRSLSTPGHRFGLLYDASSSYSAREDSPYKHRLSTFNRD